MVKPVMLALKPLAAWSALSRKELVRTGSDRSRRIDGRLVGRQRT
jgi:hypothetical protein